MAYLGNILKREEKLSPILTLIKLISWHKIYFVACWILHVNAQNKSKINKMKKLRICLKNSLYTLHKKNVFDATVPDVWSLLHSESVPPTSGVHPSPMYLAQDVSIIDPSYNDYITYGKSEIQKPPPPYNDHNVFSLIRHKWIPLFVTDRQLLHILQCI